MASLIEAAGLSKTFMLGGRSLCVLRNVNLDVAPGEFLAVTGPSGSGKTTLLHILGGLEQPTSGTYRFAGLEFSALDDDARSHARATRIGFVFQAFHLLPQLNVLENVALPFLYDPDDAPDSDERAADALAQVGLSHRLEHRPAELSGGEMQRAAIARAIVTRPELLLADEPTGNLDSRTGREILDILARLNDAGATLVIVTHDDSVAQRARRHARMEDGCLASS